MMMSTFKACVYFFAVLICSNRVAAQQCFTFRGDSYLRFNVDRFDNSHSVHYELEFKTNEVNGILMYAVGPHGDFESLFIQGGHLHYFLFNVAPSGIAGQFGAHHVSDETVNNNAWMKVHLYRQFQYQESVIRPFRNKTGFEFELNGRLRQYVDNFNREGIDLFSEIYFGGYSSSLSPIIGNFTGQMRGMKENKHDYNFENPTLNFKSRVNLQCP